MKTCPYCAEEIQDAAIKCRYCHSWLVSEIPPGAETPPAGMGPEATAMAVTPEPSATAMAVTPEPAADTGAEAVSADASASDTLPATEPEPGTQAPDAATVEGATAAEAPGTTEQKVEFTHSGERYLLGYTDEFFGIWDRQSPASPLERFPRSDAGWSQIWQRYIGMESNWMDLRTGQRSP